MFRLAVVLLLLLGAAPVHSDEPPAWLLDALKKDDPDSLDIWVFSADGCPFGADHVIEMVEGVLIRSRIKPTYNWTYGDPTLNVMVDCTDIETQADRKLGYVLSADIWFGRTNPKPIIRYDHDFSTYWVMPTNEDGMDEVKTQVEKAITAYILANFDLGGDE